MSEWTVNAWRERSPQGVYVYRVTAAREERPRDEMLLVEYQDSHPRIAGLGRAAIILALMLAHHLAGILFESGERRETLVEGLKVTIQVAAPEGGE